MHKFVFVGLLLSALLLFSGSSWSAERYYIDVRSDEEFNAGHVSVAVHIPYDQIAERIGEVTENPEAEIYLYCRSGNRAGKALDVLEAMGFTNVQNLATLDEARAHASRHADSSLIFD